MKRHSQLFKLLFQADIAIIALFMTAVSYRAIQDFGENIAAALVGSAIIVIVFFIFLVNDLLGIKLVRKLNNYDFVSQKMLTWITVMYVLMCFCFILLVILDFFILKSLYPYRHRMDILMNFGVAQIIIEITLMLLVFPSLLKIIFTWVLVGAVKQNYRQFMMQLDFKEDSSGFAAGQG